MDVPSISFLLLYIQRATLRPNNVGFSQRMLQTTYSDCVPMRNFPPQIPIPLET